MFGGMEELVNKRIQPVIQSIEKKLIPKFDELAKKLEENTKAVNRLSDAIEKIAKILSDSED